MVILRFHPIFMTGNLPRPLSILPEAPRDPATCVRAGPGRP